MNTMSQELLHVRFLNDTLIRYILDAPKQTLALYVEQRSLLLKLENRLAAFESDSVCFDRVSFKDLEFSDLVGRMHEWSSEQQRLIRVRTLAQEHLRRAIYRRPDFIEDLNSLILELSKVINRAVQQLPRLK